MCGRICTADSEKEKVSFFHSYVIICNAFLYWSCQASIKHSLLFRQQARVPAAAVAQQLYTFANKIVTILPTYRRVYLTFGCLPLIARRFLGS